jgi:hypothetical protein
MANIVARMSDKKDVPPPKIEGTLFEADKE